MTAVENAIARRPRTIALILLLVGVLRIAATWTIFSETADEPMHLTAGLQVLSAHRYGMQLSTPPLPRVVTAAMPYVAGLRYDTSVPPFEFMLRTFYITGHYKTTLVLVRAGTLVFFILGAICTWMWARRELNELAGVAAMLFFTTEPSILAHSALATVDAAAASGLALSLLMLSRWLDRPDLGRACALGAAWGFSILCKFSLIGFVPAACLAAGAVRLAYDPALRAQWRKAAGVAVVPFVAAAVIWAGYAFAIGDVATLAPLKDYFGKRSIITATLSHLSPNMPVPAPAFIVGVANLTTFERDGFQSYFFGKSSMTGWRSYFPVALALKTTIGSLLIFLAGFFFVRDRPARRLYHEAVAAAAAVMLVSLHSPLDLGIRYILPIYAPMAVASGVSLVALFAAARQAATIAAAALLTWHLVAGAIAHPDYLAYFNELGGHDPSRYLIDSNLDWGQDVLRLRDELRRRHIQSFGWSVFGCQNLQKLGFPPHSDINPWLPMQGWLAVSDHSYRMAGTQDGWRWLQHRRYIRVGKSIRLYYMP